MGAALCAKEKGEKGSCSLGDKFVLSAIPKSLLFEGTNTVDPGGRLAGS